MTSRLTVDLGLRWEYNGVPSEIDRVAEWVAGHHGLSMREMTDAIAPAGEVAENLRLSERLAGLEADLSPRPAGEQAVRRPRSSILLDTRSADLGLAPSRSWEEALAWYLEVRAARRE